MAESDTQTAPAKAKQAEAHLTNKDAVKAVGTLLLVPRSKAGLKKIGDYTLDPDYLSDFLIATDGGPGRSANPLNTGTAQLKALELRYYIDLAESQGSKWYSHREITAIVPNAHKALLVKWEIVEPKGLAGFGSFAAGKEKLERKTTADGVCEVTIVVPLAKYDRQKLLNDRKKADQAEADKAEKAAQSEGTPPPPKPDPKRPLEIVIRASLAGATNPESSKELRLTIARNSDIKDLDEIYQPGDKDGKGNHLLVFQPDKKKVEAEADPDAPPPAKPAKPAPNLAVLKLNHLLNQVVPRHRAVKSYTFAHYSGAYSDETRRAVEGFVTHFPSVKPAPAQPPPKPGHKAAEAPSWSYDLSNVGVYKSLIPYLLNEYNFDWTKNKGWVVDRHLLIGDELCDPTEYTKIDGLYELKVGVVDRLVQQIIERAEQYFACDVPWLHKPEDTTYVPGFDEKDNKKIPRTIEMVEGIADHVRIYDQAHNPVVADGKPLAFLQGERRVRFSVNTSDDGTWHEIRLDADNNTGWVKDSEVGEVQAVAGGKKKDRDVYDAAGGNKTGTTLDANQRVSKLDSQTLDDGTTWWKVPVRMKNHDVWLKASEVNCKQIVRLTGEVQVYDDDGQPNTIAIGGDYAYLGQDQMVPPQPAAAATGGAADAGTAPDAGYADAGSADGGAPPVPAPIACYRIAPTGIGGTLVQQSDAGVSLVWLIIRKPQGKMYAEPDDSKPLLDAYDQPITLDNQTPKPLIVGPLQIEPATAEYVGDLLWLKIRANITTSGWVKQDSLGALTEDRFQAEDLGDYGNQDGSFGVAYSFGCKNTPEDFIQRLQVQLPEDKGQFKRQRIAAGDGAAGDILRWDEYSIGQRVGLRDEYLFNPENPRDWAGIDCSGFAQNCTTYATFRPEGETERIVPETVVKDLKKTPGAEVGASAAIGNYARLMSYDKGNDGETHFLRGGDILTTESHIVIVDGTADQIVLVPPDAPPDPPPDDPDPLSLEFLGNCKKAVKNREYLVVNAFGVMKSGPVYTRKTIRMPQSYWGVTLGSGLNSGRIYIWH
jgi:hypothetical protein